MDDKIIDDVMKGMFKVISEADPLMTVDELIRALLSMAFSYAKAADITDESMDRLIKSFQRAVNTDAFSEALSRDMESIKN
jgi:hypothetical protein